MYSFMFSPESMGLVSGGIFLVLLFLFIPIPFSNAFLDSKDFRHDEVIFFNTIIFYCIQFVVF